MRPTLPNKDHEVVRNETSILGLGGLPLHDAQDYFGSVPHGAVRYVSSEYLKTNELETRLWAHRNVPPVQRSRMTTYQILAMQVPRSVSRGLSNGRILY